MKVSPRFNVFRHDQLTLHSKRLRDMLGPLLSKGCSRTQSCAAILAITTTAWELSFKMHTSHLSFKIFFPETTAKFNSDSMIALGTTEDPHQLQCQQTRLNLVVTPVITLRDDRGTTIKVKNVCKADVLILTWRRWSYRSVVWFSNPASFGIPLQAVFLVALPFTLIVELLVTLPKALLSDDPTTCDSILT